MMNCSLSLLKAGFIKNRMRFTYRNIIKITEIMFKEKLKH